MSAVEARAGKMKLANRMLQPDTRKGLIRLFTSPDDQLLHFTWTSRTNGLVEDDRILFPGDATFTYVEQARNNAKNSRVYVLKFVDSNEKMFFWMQEPKADKDDDFVRRVNAKLNPDGAAQAASVDLGQMDQQQLLSLLSGESPAAAPSLDNPSAGQQPSADVEMSETEIHNSAQASNTSEGSGNVTAPQVGGISSANLSQILSNLGSGQTASGQNLNLSNLAAAQAANMYSGPNLEDVLEPRSVIQALEDCPDLKDALLQDLPEADRTPQALREVVSSPQLAQAIGLLDHVIQSGQGNNLISSFGYKPAEGFATMGPAAILAKSKEKQK